MRYILTRLAALALAVLLGYGSAAEPETAPMTNSFIPLADGYFVSPQIAPDDVAAAKALGVTLIINNRPDGEALGQPKGADIEAAAKAAGISYVAIPIRGMAIGSDQIEALNAALSAHEGPALAFCRTGTRSTVLRAYAEARDGKPADAIIAEAAKAGYDIAGARETLISLGAK